MTPVAKTPVVRSLLGLASVLVPTGIVLAMAFEKRWLDDDGFINLRIVRNLLSGHGPVFNLGERVEAGTSPLWLGLVTLLGALGVRLEDASVYMGIVFTGAAVLLAQDAASRLHTPRQGLRERLARGWLPLGALTVAVLPPIWDYASGGLETSLSLLWLAGSYDLLLCELDSEPVRARRQPASALLLGLGILIRPELTLYALGFFTLFVLSALRSALGRAAMLRRLAVQTAAFAALPVSYQVFRMGYYGALSPNTAIAKEAFLVNWPQGLCYLRNLFEPYLLSVPVVVLLLLVAWLSVVFIRKAKGTSARLRLAALLLPCAIAVVHTFYVVRMGGDYMHARMLLPAVFALLLPVAVVPAFAGGLLNKGITALAALVVVGWSVYCGSSLRVAVENQCDIGDERGWYAREAKVDNPVRIEDYDKHMFVSWGRGLAAAVRATCPELATAAEGSSAPGCRLVHLSGDEAREVYPLRITYPMAAELDARLLGVTSQGAIGMAGFLLPDNVFLADVHGLADPLVSRAQLAGRGRPGHEKTMPIAWRLARFAASLGEGEDASVTAARRALRCGPLADLQSAVRAPLTVASFLANAWHAPALTRLRIPRDPFEAEAQFCGGSPITLLASGGGGGDAFHWRCPTGTALSRVGGAFDTPTGTIAKLEASCLVSGVSTSSPAFGANADVPFDLRCPAGAEVIGLFGTADSTVHSLGLICGGNGPAARTQAAGVARGEAYELSCAAGERARSFRGRAGALVDAVGLGCSQ